MPRITKVYTRTGDDGTTALGTKERIPKDSPRIEAYGTVDELCSYVGAVLADPVCEEIQNSLQEIQNDLFHLGSDLCIPEEDKKKLQVPQIEQRHIDKLEKLMDALSERLKPLDNFVLPGGAPSAAKLHVARTVCRRAEREVVRLSKKQSIGLFAIKYLNRLSDALFVMARYENFKQGKTETLWDSRA